MIKILHADLLEAKNLAKISADADAAESALEEVAGAPLASDDIAQNLKRLVEAKAEKVKPYMNYFTMPGKPEIPELDINLLCFIFGDDLVERIVTKLKLEGSASGLPAEARGGEIKKLKARLAKLLEQEERETLRLEDAGFVVLRRADPDPEMLLRVWNE